MNYVDLELAKALKEKGYNKPCKAYYRTTIDGNHLFFYEPKTSVIKEMDFNSLPSKAFVFYSAPLVKDAFDWVMEKYPTSKNFNETHPELQEGEVFILNVVPTESLKNWKNPCFESFRIGKFAYDNTGNQILNMFPLFGKLKK
jgi:hypothetical protein